MYIYIYIFIHILSFITNHTYRSLSLQYIIILTTVYTTYILSEDILHPGVDFQRRTLRRCSLEYRSESNFQPTGSVNSPQYFLWGHVHKFHRLTLLTVPGHSRCKGEDVAVADDPLCYRPAGNPVTP